MTAALEGQDFGFTLQPSNSRHHPAVKVNDTDFADDLSLIRDSVAEAREFLMSSVGLHLNDGKTKYLGVNIRDDDSQTLSAISGERIDKVEDLVHLGY
jgi:hypothetical protein